MMKETSYVYIDEKNFVTYANDEDSNYNRIYTNWKRFVMPSKNVIPFMKYYQLRFHPLALKNKIQ